MKILFVTPHFPWPPLTREQVRAYYQIRHLSERHSVTLLALTTKDNIARYRLELEKLGVRTIIVQLNRFRSSLNLLRNVFSPTPFEVSYFFTKIFLHKLGCTATDGAFDIAHFQLPIMIPYAASLEGIPTVVDFIDAPTVNLTRRYRHRQFWMKPLRSVELSRMARYEAQTGDSITGALVTSDADKKAMHISSPVSVNPSGVDLHAFPYVCQRRQQSTLIFSGNMADLTNIDAVMSFYRNIFPLIRKKRDDLRFYVVGANPPYYIRRLSKDERVIVTGLVPDVHRYQEASTISICPSSLGAGLQNKVLEAMASGTPVVATSAAVAGMDVVPGQHLLTADSASEFAGRVLDLLDNEPQQRSLASEARQLVESKYTWDASVRQLEMIYQEILGSRQNGVGKETKAAEVAS